MQLERGEWLERSQGSSSTPSSLSVVPQRRRSSALYRPSGPPPSQPIPNLPPDIDSQDRQASRPSFSRAPSAGLAAVAHFSQIRQTASAPADQSPPAAADTPDEFSDPPPLFAPSSRMSERPSDSTSRHLSPPSAEHRPSSRRALTRALELAREAVQLDSTNEDPEAAVQAYAQSVALLSEVMERVRRGEDTTDSRRGRRRRSVAAQEEEVRRLQNIHDTYADRMNILSIIYSIPPVPYSSTHSVSSTNTNSPTASTFPSSENSPLIPQVPYTGDDAQYNVEFSASEGSLPAGSPLTFDSLLTNDISGLPPSSAQHPYAAVPQPPPPSQNSNPASRSVPPLKPRSRASSHLPPQTQPPLNPLPPAPANPEPLDQPFSQSLQRPDDRATRRLSDLASLSEESEDGRVNNTPRNHDADFQDMALDTPRNSRRDSHPLPPIPSPSTSTASSGTPRNSIHILKAPASPKGPRRPSVTTRSEIIGPTAPQSSPIINPTPSHGIIHQRRTKTSLPSRSASPSDSTLSAGSIQPPLPAVPAPPPSAHTGRARSSSQPGRRPSLVNAAIEQRPPLPPSAGSNISTRKPSFPSKLVPSALGTMQHSGETQSPQVGTPIPSFAPLPALSISTGVVPFVPASTMLQSQPSDPLRMPYHMMDLLATSMTSPTGGYITRRLHVPNEVWTFGGAKLSNVPDKIRALEILHAALSELQTVSSEYFGAGNVSSGMAMGIGSMGQTEAKAWVTKLDEFLSVCDTVVGDYGKKLGVGEGFVLRKTTWGGKLGRRFEKFANSKNVDSPAAYMHNLRKLFQDAQLLDEHTKAVFSTPIALSYSAISPEIRIQAEQKLKRTSEFFASVVLAFVIRDLALLLDKYVKKCAKILEE